MVKIKLNRDLRRDILRGHPWVYRNALEKTASPAKSELCQVFDRKEGFLAWAFFQPKGPLALRILSLAKKPPGAEDFYQRIDRAYKLRKPVRETDTTAFRLINGEGDLLPGLVCDIYGEQAVFQCDGDGPREFWDVENLAEYLVRQQLARSVVFKGRGEEGKDLKQLAGEAFSDPLEIRENSVLFKVKVAEGQKTGLFLDQRDNRQYVRQLANRKTVLNVFSYTGGFSMYAGRGGAARVRSLDLSKGALELAQENWELNGLKAHEHETLWGDAFDILENYQDQEDVVIVDPPSMAPSEKHKEAASQKYMAAFAAAAKRVKPEGHLILSSCSSHIQFDDFFKIIEGALAKARRQGRILRVSGQGLDHPFPHVCHELRYLKFVDVVLS